MKDKITKRTSIRFSIIERINYYFSDPLKKHNNSIESVKETEKQSKEAAPLSDFLSSHKGDNSPPSERHGKICRALLRFLRNSDAVPTVKNICTALVEFEEYLDDIQNRYGKAENAKDNDTQKILLHTTLGHRHFLHFCIFPDKTPQTMHLTTKTAPFLKCLKQSS